MMDIPDTGAIFTLGKSYLADNSQSYFFIKNDSVKFLISGATQSAVICESGRLFVWGENQFGQLGIGGNGGGGTNKANNENQIQIVTKPTCVKTLKTLGLKCSNAAFGDGWCVILTTTNEIFFTGKNIFSKETKVYKNFELLNNQNNISYVRKPFRLKEFNGILKDNGNNNSDEYFNKLSAGNEHFVLLTSSGRLFGWGSNKFNQLGLPGKELITPVELSPNLKIINFTCGPYTTLIQTETNQFFLTGQLNDFQFSTFTELQFNYYLQQQQQQQQHDQHNNNIIYFHISKTNEIYLISDKGIIYRGNESLRIQNIIFQQFYDYDSEENGQCIKLLKGTSFFVVLTKNYKLFTTFSESGHHLKTFREISKLKNLRVFDIAVGDKHVLVMGIPRSVKNFDRNQFSFNKFTITPTIATIINTPDVNGNSLNQIISSNNVKINENPNEIGKSSTENTSDKIENHDSIIKVENVENNNNELHATMNNNRGEIEENSKILNEKENSSESNQFKNENSNSTEFLHNTQNTDITEEKHEHENSMENLTNDSLPMTNHINENTSEIAQKEDVKSITAIDEKSELKSANIDEKTTDLNNSSDNENSVLSDGKVNNEKNVDSSKSEIPMIQTSDIEADTKEISVNSSNVDNTDEEISSNPKEKSPIADNDKKSMESPSSSDSALPEKQQSNSNDPSITPQKSRKGSAKSIKFDQKSLKSIKSQDRLIRPNTPYPDGTPQTVKRVQSIIQNSNNDDMIENTTPNLTDSLENIPELSPQHTTTSTIAAMRRPSLKYSDRKDKYDEIVRKASAKPSLILNEHYLELDDDGENDEKLEIEIKTDDLLDQTTVNEIRFINNGIDITERIHPDTLKFEKQTNENSLPSGSTLETSKMYEEKNNEVKTFENNIQRTDPRINKLKLKVVEDDERTTASVNSNKNENHIDDDKEMPVQDNENNLLFQNAQSQEQQQQLQQQQLDDVDQSDSMSKETKKKKVQRFIDDLKSKGKEITCRAGESIRVEDDPPKYTSVEEGLNRKTSKVCTIF